MRSSMIPASIFALAACIPGWTATEIRERAAAVASSPMDVASLFQQDRSRGVADPFGRVTPSDVRAVSSDSSHDQAWPRLAVNTGPGLSDLGPLGFSGGTILYDDRRVLNSGVFDAPAKSFAGTRVQHTPARFKLSGDAYFRGTGLARGLTDGGNPGGFPARPLPDTRVVAGLKGPSTFGSGPGGGNGPTIVQDETTGDDGAFSIAASVPVPASVPLLLTALGGFALVKRRRSRG